jgi:WD40 repeat protein
MGTEQPTPKRRWRPRFSLLTLVLAVIFVGACGGLWWRWAPWAVERHFISNLMGTVEATFSRDEQRIATAEFDGGLGIWSVDGQPIRHWVGHTYHANRVVFSQDGTRLLSASDDNTARIWDTENGNLLAVLRSSSEAPMLAMFAPDQQSVITRHALDKVFLWNITAACKRVGNTDAEKAPILVSLDGRCTRLPNALTAEEGELDAALQKCRRTDDDEESSVVSRYENAVVPSDGLWALLERANGTLHELGPVPACVRVLIQGKERRILAISRSGRQLLLSDSDTSYGVGSVSILDVSGMEVLLADQPTRISSVGFSWDETKVLGAGPDQFACVWDSDSAKRLAVLPLPKCGFFKYAGIAPSRDGGRLLTTCLSEDDPSLTLWSRRRPEYWWGIAWLPESWVALLSGGALLVIAARRLRAREATKAVAA